MAAVLAVGLREHHQLDVGRIAPQVAERLRQVIDFVFGQRQPQRHVGLLQRGAALGLHRHGAHRLAGQRLEQRLAVERAVDHGLGHAVVQAVGRARQHVGVERLGAQQAAFGRQRVTHAALDAAHGVQATIVRDIGRLAGPRRHRPQARNDQQLQALGRRLGGRRAVVQQLRQTRLLFGRQGAVGMDEMLVARGDIGNRQAGLLQLRQQALAAESGKDGGTGQMLDKGHDAGAVRKKEESKHDFTFLPGFTRGNPITRHKTAPCRPVAPELQNNSIHGRPILCVAI
ncbi:Uncharacterised protein [Bordetella pertussis]|nr:Uncharacterised protein [Bordetella pertussis]CPP31075.1 Uncharacterised protein [Bordetella pertussis]